MNAIVDILREAPATTVEIAALLDCSPHSVITRIWHLQRRGVVVNTGRKVRPLERHRGRHPYLWAAAGQYKDGDEWGMPE